MQGGIQQAATLGGEQSFVVLAMDRPLQVADAPAGGKRLLFVIGPCHIAIDADQ